MGSDAALKSECVLGSGVGLKHSRNPGALKESLLGDFRQWPDSFFAPVSRFGEPGMGTNLNSSFRPKAAVTFSRLAVDYLSGK